MKYIAVTMLIMLLLVACLPTNVSAPTLTEAPVLDSTPTEKPALPSKNTSTPVPLIPAPVGLTYRTDTELWQVETTGESHLVYQYSNGNTAFISPNNTHILFLEYASSNQTQVTQYILDLATLQKTLIYPQDNLNICLFTWMPGRSDIIYTVLLPDEADPGYSCERGSPVFLSVDGSNLIVLDEEGSGWSSPSVSPNGRYVAFDKNGQPWLYELGKSALLFDINHYDVAQLDKTYYSSPSWSPDSNQLAWIKVQKTQNSEQREIIIFDIRNNTFTSLSPCNAENSAPCSLHEFEGQPHIAWSSDGNYLSVINHSLDSHGIYSLDGNHERIFGNGFYSMEWSPADSWYARIESTELCLEVIVESSDGEESQRVGCGRRLKWSPDGSKLIFGEKEHGWWLVDIKTWSVNQIDVPQGSEITDWLDISTQ